MTTAGFSHIDGDTLADLAEGLLEAPEADAVRLHFASCAACSADYALISGLVAVPWESIEPDPIPAEVAARVEAALHREPAVRPTPHPAAGREVRKPRSRRFMLAFKVLAASSVVIVGGFVGIAAISSSGTTTSSTAASGTGVAAPNAAHGDAMLSIQQRASQLLSGATAAGGIRPNASSPEPSATDTSGKAAGPYSAQILACWQDLRPDAKLLTSSPYVYQGQNAEMLIFENPADRTRAEVVVVPTTCPAKILAATSVARS